MKNKKTIAVDMDGVLADVDAQFITWYHREYGIKVPYEHLIGKTEGAGFPDKGAARRYVRTPGFFRTLPLIDGAIDAIQRLMEDYEIFIVSAAMEFPQSLPEKYEWLNEHFPFISWKNIIFCGDKSVIAADYMIDDHPRNLISFKGTPILFDAAHNAGNSDYRRVRSWTEVLELFEAKLRASI